MVFIGIDPGKKGGVAVIYEDICNVYPYSDKNLIQVCWIYRRNCFATVENVHAMPGQGVTSTFSFGKSFGYILGVLDAYGIPHTEVDPRAWKKEFGVTADKKTSIWKCEELYPGLNLYPTKRSRTKSDGMAESVLISLYGMKHYERRADDTN